MRGLQEKSFVRKGGSDSSGADRLELGYLPPADEAPTTSKHPEGVTNEGEMITVRL